MQIEAVLLRTLGLTAGPPPMLSRFATVVVALAHVDEDLIWQAPSVVEGDRDVVTGIAVYERNILPMLKYFAGTLRLSGYSGEIILGVSPSISEGERRYLRSINCTHYAVKAISCGEAASIHSDSTRIRGACSAKYPRLKLEWARYQLAKDWIEACPHCTGWALVSDVRDAAFFGHPFRELGNPDTTANDLLLIEEYAGKDRGLHNDNWFSWAGIYKCYGFTDGKKIVDRYRSMPVLNSGTTIGTRSGIIRYLRTIVKQFQEMVDMGRHCQPPSVPGGCR